MQFKEYTAVFTSKLPGCFMEMRSVCVNVLVFEDLFVALDQGKASGAIMAIENTVAGGLLPNYSLLHKHSRKVKGEVFLRIQPKPDGFARADYRRDY